MQVVFQETLNQEVREESQIQMMMTTVTVNPLRQKINTLSYFKSPQN